MVGRATVPILFLLSLLILALASRFSGIDLLRSAALDVIAPIESLATGAARGANVATIDEIIVENQRLKAENERLVREAAQAPELQREVEQLRELLVLRRQGAAWQWMAARVIAFDSSNLIRSVTINRGSRDGLVEGMTVMAPRGLVGKIVQLGSVASRALLISDPGSSVNGVVQRTRARGVVHGQRGAAGATALAMRQVAQGEDMRAGDVVITSGLGGIFPEGVPIGRIREVRQRDTDMFQEAVVEPFVVMDRLEEVFVIANHVPVKLD